MMQIKTEEKNMIGVKRGVWVEFRGSFEPTDFERIILKLWSHDILSVYSCTLKE